MNSSAVAELEYKISQHHSQIAQLEISDTEQKKEIAQQHSLLVQLRNSSAAHQEEVTLYRSQIAQLTQMVSTLQSRLEGMADALGDTCARFSRGGADNSTCYLTSADGVRNLLIQVTP